MLSGRAIKNIKLLRKPAKYFDVRGLYLLVAPTGRKGWRFKYYFGGKEKLLSFGAYPEVSLQDARNGREAARRTLARGIDPSAARREQRHSAERAAASTFEAVALQWHESVKEAWQPVHHAGTLARLRLHAFPMIGNRPIAEVGVRELLAVIRRTGERRTTGVAHRVAQACRQIFRFAMAAGCCERNPAVDLWPAMPPRPRMLPRVGLAPDELPSLLRSIDDYNNGWQTRFALLLLALTFVRTRELTGATWAEIDLEKAEWTIPAARMKSRKPHHVPLSRQAVEVLRVLCAINGRGPWVFTGRSPRRPMHDHTMLYALYRMGYRGKMSGHGFRVLASTTLNEMGFRADVIERQLAHSERNAVRAAYHRSQYLEERTAMMQAWADHLDACRVAGANVVALRAVVLLAGLNRPRAGAQAAARKSKRG